jgi:hypothetical protein
MTATEPLSPRLNDLLSALCENTIEDHEFDELQQLLTRDPAALRAYIDYLDLHACLPRQFSAIPPTVEADLVQLAAPPVKIAASRSFWMAGSSTIAACLVALVFYGGFVLLAWNLRPDPSSSNGRDDASILAEVKSANRPVATLTASTGATWNQSRHDKPPRENSAIRADEVLELTSGQAQLTFADGARVVLEGPCQFVPQNTGRGRLERGKLRASVPAQAIGFAIATPTIEIIDLGTEFGVEADVKGQTDVEVFQGKVDVKYLSAVGVAQSPHRTIRMNAGQAKRFSHRNGTSKVTVVDVSREMKDRQGKTSSIAARKESPAETASEQYAAAIMADHPLGYWRLSDGHREVAADASGNGLNGRYCGSIRTAQPGLFEGATDSGVRLLGASAPGWIEIDNVELPASFSFEAWVRSPTPEWDVDEWFASGRIPQGFIMGPGNNRAWRFLLVQDDIQAAYTVGWHSPEKIDDRFHHYVGTYDVATDRGCMYFDGVLVEQTQPLVGEQRSDESRKLTLYVGRDPYTGARTCGHGWLDEVALYPRALSAESVRKHFEVWRDGTNRAAKIDDQGSH